MRPIAIILIFAILASNADMAFASARADSVAAERQMERARREARKKLGIEATGIVGLLSLFATIGYANWADRRRPRLVPAPAIENPFAVAEKDALEYLRIVTSGLKGGGRAAQRSFLGAIGRGVFKLPTLPPLPKAVVIGGMVLWASATFANLAFLGSYAWDEISKPDEDGDPGFPIGMPPEYDLMAGETPTARDSSRLVLTYIELAGYSEDQLFERERELRNEYLYGGTDSKRFIWLHYFVWRWSINHLLEIKYYENRKKRLDEIQAQFDSCRVNGDLKRLKIQAANIKRALTDTTYVPKPYEVDPFIVRIR